MFINNDNVTLSNLMVITVTVRDAGLNVKYNTIMWGGTERGKTHFEGVRERERAGEREREIERRRRKDGKNEGREKVMPGGREKGSVWKEKRVERERRVGE